MRLTMLIPHFGHGGDWVIVKNLTHQLLRMPGYEVTINGLSSESIVSDPNILNPMPLNRGGAGLWYSWAARHRIPRDTDVLHAHSPNALVFAWLLKWFYCGRARIAFTFHWPVPEGDLRRILKRSVFHLADQCHVYSLAIDRIMKNDYGLPTRKVKLIYLGVPVDQFSPFSTEEKAAARESRNIPPDTPMIGFIGRLATEKNADFLVHFMARQHIRYPDLHCAIAGTGDREKVIREAAASSGCADRIHFLGYTRKPQEIYPIFDLHILPSAFEAFALTVIEAAYCGVPTLRSNVQGSAEQIDDGMNGFVFDISGGYKAFEAKLIDILDHHWERLPFIGSASQKKCTRLCNMHINGQRMDAFYRALAAS